ncbi:MAG: glutathione S-transferase family protein [Gammaproteobacteria bacterium]|nr:glutathione S-transferase family protein [Gammaproteobacteria bacterium]
MPELTLVIGTRNYSSWSLRPWLLLRHLGLPFAERVYELETPEFAREVPRWSPTGRVPVLLHGPLRVWESLAICEYASELAGGRGWPEDAAARARARAVAAEMHAGFQALRSACPMNTRARGRRVPLTPAVLSDLRRLDALWSDCRRDFAAAGPWLFGHFSAADAMYAPVALRVRTYDLPLGEVARGWCATMLADPQLQEWLRAAAAETRVIASDEAGA